MDQKPLIIGTRASPLALAQANTVAALLNNQGANTQLLPLKTTGDILLSESLDKAGGKGLFTKELDIQQLNGNIDIAVHSTKDLPTQLPEGLLLWGYLPREDARDALISLKANTIEQLPQNARIGSASLRRSSLLKNLRPDVTIELLRGNVNTRLQKLKDGQFDATLLAVAGLKRLGLEHEITTALDENIFIPAPGQGAIALVVRTSDIEKLEPFANILCHQTFITVSAERVFLATLEGSCRTAIGAHAIIKDDKIHFKGVILSPDGAQKHNVEGIAFNTLENATQLAQNLGQQLRATAPHLLPT